jgi:hypothetical protein
MVFRLKQVFYTVTIMLQGVKMSVNFALNSDAVTTEHILCTKIQLARMYCCLYDGRHFCRHDIW